MASLGHATRTLVGRYGRPKAAIPCSGRTSATRLGDMERGRRVRRRDRETPKRPKPVDLEEEMNKALLAEEAKWAGPSTEELVGEKPHPLLGAVLEASVRRMLETNVCCRTMMDSIYEKKFPGSRAFVDYMEYRLLEIDGKGVLPVRQFFLDFGYRERTSFVTSDKQTPIHSEILFPPQRRNLPKIVLSHLKVDQDLSSLCREAICRRLGDWLSLSERYGSTALGVTEAPWSLPTENEFALIEGESSFAAWCMMHGFMPATVAMSVNEMRKAFYKFGANPEHVTLEDIVRALEGSYPMNPVSERPIWSHYQGTLRVASPVAEVIPTCLLDGRGSKIPGSHLAFVDRQILPEFEKLKEEDEFVGYEEEHYNHEIDAEFLSYMHGSINTALTVDEQAASVHKQVIERAKREGKVLTLDGSNEEDEALYKEYFRQVVEQSVTAEGQEMMP